MENVNAFINSGGNATWSLLVFKHNQNQIEDAKRLSENWVSKILNMLSVKRWQDFNGDGEYREIDIIGG